MRRAKPRFEPAIETERLVLRPLRDHDLGDLVAGINDAAVTHMLARVPFPYRRSDADAFLSASRRGVASGRSLFFVVEYRQRLIGGIGIDAIPYVSELGYWLGKADWGKGFASEASLAVLAHAFEVRNLPSVRSGGFADNPASLRVQRKLAFRRIGPGWRRSLARGTEVAHIDTVLTPARFRQALR